MSNHHMATPGVTHPMQVDHRPMVDLRIGEVIRVTQLERAQKLVDRLRANTLDEGARVELEKLLATAKKQGTFDGTISPEAHDSMTTLCYLARQFAESVASCDSSIT